MVIKWNDIISMQIGFWTAKFSRFFIWWNVFLLFWPNSSNKIPTKTLNVRQSFEFHETCSKIFLNLCYTLIVWQSTWYAITCLVLWRQVRSFSAAVRIIFASNTKCLKRHDTCFVFHTTKSRSILKFKKTQIIFVRIPAGNRLALKCISVLEKTV